MTSRENSLRDVLVEEFQNKLTDLRGVRFKGEVSGIEQMHLGLREVAAKGLRSRWNEVGIVLAPRREKGGLSFPKVFLERR